jgi:proline iminopeptidase
MSSEANAPSKTKELRDLYPEIEPYKTGMLKVSKIHTLYYEEVGNPSGNPIVFIHGGPGGGTDPRDRRFFDPQAYRILVYHQRGAGDSTPNACLEENTTWDLVDDLEKLRKHFNVDKWVLFGGSWGSTLALAYAETHPDRVKALILRGIFCCRRKELLWFYQEGASYIFPDAWDKYLEPIPIGEQGDLMSAYHRRLTGNNEEEKLKAATAWSVWELATSRLYVDPSYIAHATDDAKFAVAFARIETHYFVHGAFMNEEGQLLKNADKIKDIPGVIVQGRYDVVCPARSAWDLHKVWSKGELHWVDDAGHSSKEVGIVHQLVTATDKFREL